MKFGSFKIGKSKEKAAPQENEEEAIPQEILDSQEDDSQVRHNAPIQELSLEAEATEEGPDTITADEAEGIPEDSAEGVKMVEMQAEPAAAPAEAKEEEKMDLNASINSIFTNVEDEENPLANLVNSLPEVAATELIDDLKEISDIIKDWQKK